MRAAAAVTDVHQAVVRGRGAVRRFEDGTRGQHQCGESIKNTTRFGVF